MKIYTKTGDGGETGLFGGGRVPKYHHRVEAYGAVDEANAVLGLAAAHCPDDDLRHQIERVQAELFEVGADLATPLDAKTTHIIRVNPANIERLEREIDAWEETLPPLQNFILPGGSATGAALHIARTVCRRAERSVAILAEREHLPPDAQRYLNRLSDWLFVLARVINHRAAQPETPWHPQERRSDAVTDQPITDQPITNQPITDQPITNQPPPMPQPTRTEAWNLVCSWIQNEGLRKHVLCVEAATRAYARKFGADEELWGVAALVHDLDYERYPDMDDPISGHPRTALQLFREWDWPEELIHAVAAHADFLGVPALTPLDKTLRACDEITGLIIATTYVRPRRDVREVSLSSIKKKWKDRRFTAAIDRDEIAHNVAALGEDLDTHIQFVLEAMQGIAAELGLDGHTN